MAKMTLLEMVQDILSDMDSDPVNSINDTMEAQQVAQIIKTTYYEMINSRKYPHLNELIEIDASGDNTKPVWMSIPANAQYIEWIKYNKIESGETADDWSDVIYLDPKDFLDHVQSRNEDDTNVTKYDDYNGTPLLIKTDQAPTYWTTFDDEYVVFDSFDSAVDTTLQKSKTQVWAYMEPSWSGLDTAYPDFPAKHFPGFLAEAKSTCFNNLKQYPNVKEEQKSRRQRTFLAQEKWRMGGKKDTPNYGR